MSDKTEIFKALARFHTLVSQPRKDGKNPFLKSNYATLPQILTCIAEAAPKCGLTHYSYTKKDGDLHYCVTVLAHESGQLIEDTIPLLSDKKMQVAMQGLGSAISYARRYSLQNLFGLAGKEDDDGESLRPQQQQRPIPPQRPTQQQQRPQQPPQRPQYQNQQRPQQQRQG